MHIGARRVFRLSSSIALSLAAAYALNMSMAYMAPLFAFILGAAPKAPLTPKALAGVLVAITVLLGVGLLLIPTLLYYPAAGLVMVLMGMFLANYISLNLGKGPVGTVLLVGVAMITMVGQLGYGIAQLLMLEMLLSIALAVVCQWLVYPLFPEDPGPPLEMPKPEPEQSTWLAARATLIVFPAYLLGLTNPTFYTPLILKSVALGSQASEADLRGARVELLSSTFLAGVMAILFWFCLKLAPNLWMFTLWTLAFSLFITAKLYGVLPTKHAPTFWQNVMITLLILVGQAVADSANGKDPYMAFAVRMSLFISVTIYASFAIEFLEWLKQRQLRRRQVARRQMEAT